MLSKLESWKKALPCPRLWLELSKNPLQRSGLEQEPPVPQAEHSPGIQQVKPPCSIPCLCERGGTHTVWPSRPRKQEPPWSTWSCWRSSLSVPSPGRGTGSVQGAWLLHRGLGASHARAQSPGPMPWCRVHRRVTHHELFSIR